MKKNNHFSVMCQDDFSGFFFNMEKNQNFFMFVGKAEHSSGLLDFY